MRTVLLKTFAIKRSRETRYYLEKVIESREKTVFKVPGNSAPPHPHVPITRSEVQAAELCVFLAGPPPSL